MTRHDPRLAAAARAAADDLVAAAAQLARPQPPTIATAERTFEGKTLTTYIIDGRPAWLAGDVASALGYSRRDVVPTMVRQAWAGDFIEHVDFAVLDDAAVQALRTSHASREGSHRLHGTPHLAHAQGAMVLFESGVYMACMRTKKPAGRALRRWLAEDVLPTLAREGRYAVASAPPPADPATPHPGARAGRGDPVALVSWAVATVPDAPPTIRAGWVAAALAELGLPVPVQNRVTLDGGIVMALDLAMETSR